VEVEKLHKDFIKKLEILFGKFETETFKFAKSSNTEISRELGYSDSQFSRLIHATASEGEFKRAHKNIDRILLIDKLQKQIEQSQDGTSRPRSSRAITMISLGFIVVVITAVMIVTGLYDFGANENTIPQRDYTLQWAFESAFINPYVGLNDLPDDCDFPCYKYQGQWELDKTYKLPFFRERNGFHYLATRVKMYARCMIEKSENGNMLEGYEYQRHEIWYDLRELPIDSFLNENNRLKDSYIQLEFSKDPNFVKVANIHTFFRNEFTIDSAKVHRAGKVIGRDLESVPEEQLQALIGENATVEEIKTEINMIVANRLEDFSIPITCENAEIPSADFHSITEGDKMSFDCQLTTSRFPIDYRKTFVLTEQYIKNRCVGGG
jgi:hypothetical protein